MLAGIIAFVNQDLRDEWYHQPAPYVAVGNQITRDHLTEFTETPPLIILWTRRSLANPPLPDEDHRPRALRRPSSHNQP
jgi:hypothetical protein